MADFLLYASYLHQFERSERIVLPRNNPFDDYDEKKWWKKIQNAIQIVQGRCQQVTGTGKWR